jgi:large subunit ribosomal protein L15
MNLTEIMSAGPERKKRKRVGRGIGSGRGKTCTRGTKGDGARTGSGGKLGFEGGQMPLYRRLPRRGFNNKRFRLEFATINVGQLEQVCEAGETVSLDLLKAKGVLRKNARRLKVLGFGDLTKSLTVQAESLSAQARAKIEAASGTIQEPEAR